MENRLASYIASRTCSIQSDGDAPAPGAEQTGVPLERLRNLYAYVLLGDPGAGKSKAFEEEAKAWGDAPFTVHDFLDFTFDPSKWKEKPVFIDGLDETRAGGSNDGTVLSAIRRKLDQMGRPRFRLSCRAADWLGQSDSERLRILTPSGIEFRVYRLDPLTNEDIEKILRLNHRIENPAAFVESANQHQLFALLHNPQTLGMLAKAVGPENKWPANRLQTYQLACPIVS